MCVTINLGQIEMGEATRGFTTLGGPDWYSQQQLCRTGFIILSQLVQQKESRYEKNQTQTEKENQLKCQGPFLDLCSSI